MKALIGSAFAGNCDPDAIDSSGDDRPGSFIEVPPTHIAEGQVFAPQRTAEQQRMFPALLAIHQGSSAPRDAYVAVPYRNNWYWIDDRD